MNELIDAVVAYIVGSLDDAVVTARELFAGGFYAHLAPHDVRNPFCVITLDGPEGSIHVMDKEPDNPAMYGEPTLKFSCFTTVRGPDGYTQLKAAMDALSPTLNDYVFADAQTGDAWKLTGIRVLMAHRERQIIFADPEGGWTGVFWIRYVYGNT